MVAFDVGSLGLRAPYRSVSFAPGRGLGGVEPGLPSSHDDASVALVRERLGITDGLVRISVGIGILTILSPTSIKLYQGRQVSYP